MLPFETTAQVNTPEKTAIGVLRSVSELPRAWSKSMQKIR